MNSSSIDKRYMIIDEKGNVTAIGIPDCVEKSRAYWEAKGYRLVLADKAEAERRYQEDLKKQPDISG